MNCNIFVVRLSIKEATAQSIDHRYTPKNAIDGDTTTFYHSDYTKTFGKWIQVQLITPGLVQSVIITNRLDCCGDRLKNVEVRVGHIEVKKNRPSLITRNSLCGNYTGPGLNGERVVIDCNPAIYGEYVTVQVLHDEYLNIAELEVFGNKIG